MKNILGIIFLLFLSAFASDMIDVDYNFIEHAFENTKPVTQKEFEKAVNSKTLEPVPDTFGGKLKAFLFGRKYVSNTPSSTQAEPVEPVSDEQMIKEIKSGIYFIKLVAPIISYDNKIIPAGNYKIKEQKENNQSMLVFIQGYEEFGKLKLFEFNDDKKTGHEITYSRVDIMSDDIIRIVYSTIENTKCAVARVYLQN